jgi:hypothetical protein
MDYIIYRDREGRIVREGTLLWNMFSDPAEQEIQPHRYVMIALGKRKNLERLGQNIPLLSRPVDEFKSDISKMPDRRTDYGVFTFKTDIHSVRLLPKLPNQWMSTYAEELDPRCAQEEAAAYIDSLASID